MPAARSSAAGRAALLYPRSDSLAAPRWGRICIARAQLTNGNADRVVGVSMQMKEAWPWGPHARGVRAAPVGGRCSPERGPRERGEGRGGDGTNAVICFFPFFIFFFFQVLKILSGNSFQECDVLSYAFRLKGLFVSSERKMVII